MTTLLAALVLGISVQAEDDLVYVKRATREESRTASIEATLEKLPNLELGSWHVLPGEVRGGLSRIPGKEDAVDLSAEVLIGREKKARWEDGTKYADGVLHTLSTATTWYRTVEAEDDWTATITIGLEQNWDCWANGRPVSLATHKSTYLLPSKRLDFRIPLKRGLNHVLVKINGPSEFYFSLTPFSAELQIELGRRLDADFPRLSEQSYYRLETIKLPSTLVLEVGGMAFAKDGTLLVCTRRGEIWAYRGGSWRRFANGLHQPLGIWAEKSDDVIVVQRPEMTRVRDTDGDGTADSFETIVAGESLGARGGGYNFGPVRGADGDFFISTSSGSHKGATHQGWCLKVGRDGSVTPWASGFRTPNGLGFDLEGNLFIADNQGQYLGTNALYHVERGKFYGHPDSLKWHPEYKNRWPGMSMSELDSIRTRAAVYFPHGAMGRSPSQPLCDATGGKFGPFKGQLFVGDQSSCIVMRVALERVGGALQGACFPFREGFHSGNNRLAFAADGSLWVGQTDRGFGAIGGRPYGLERLVWTGAVPMEIRSISVTSSGFDLRFTRPVGREAAAVASNFSLQHYHYKYHATYGSPRVDVTPVNVKKAEVSEDGLTVSLTLPDLAKKKIYEFHLKNIAAADSTPLLHPSAYYTLNRLPK